MGENMTKRNWLEIMQSHCELWNTNEEWNNEDPMKFTFNICIIDVNNDDSVDYLCVLFYILHIMRRNHLFYTHWPIAVIERDLLSHDNSRMWILKDTNLDYHVAQRQTVYDWLRQWLNLCSFVHSNPSDDNSHCIKTKKSDRQRNHYFAPWESSLSFVICFCFDSVFILWLYLQLSQILG